MSVEEEITLSLDLGSSSFKLAVLSSTRGVLHSSEHSFETFYGKRGEVEIDGFALWDELSSKTESLLNSLSSEDYPSYLSMSTQRESILIWAAQTGDPLHPIISWQDTRTDNLVDEISLNERNRIREKTGLWVSSYCSAPKVSYLINQKLQNTKTQYLWGTLDSWLIYKFSQGLHFVSDYVSASRTALLNLETLEWDKELFEIFKIPFGPLPKLKDNDVIIGKAKIGAHNLTIRGVIGDQQAALYASQKTTNSSTSLVYGTGAFLLHLLPETMTWRRIIKTFLFSRNITISLAWKKPEEEPRFALELSFSNSSQPIDWLLGNVDIKLSDFSPQELRTYIDREDIPLCLPFFSKRWFMSDSKIYSGGFIELQANTRSIDVLISSLEGLAFSIRKGLDILNLPKSEKITIGGGLSENKLFLISQSTFLNRDVLKLPGIHLSCLGTGLFAFSKSSFRLPVNSISPYTSNESNWVELRYQKWLEKIRQLYS